MYHEQISLLFGFESQLSEIPPIKVLPQPQRLETLYNPLITTGIINASCKSSLFKLMQSIVHHATALQHHSSQCPSKTVDQSLKSELQSS